MPARTRSTLRSKDPGTTSPVESQRQEETVTHQLDERFPDLHARITEQTYALYEICGREDGHALEDWLEAERLVLNQRS